MSHGSKLLKAVETGSTTGDAVAAPYPQVQLLAKLSMYFQQAHVHAHTMHTCMDGYTDEHKEKTQHLHECRHYQQLRVVPLSG